MKTKYLRYLINLNQTFNFSTMNCEYSIQKNKYKYSVNSKFFHLKIH